MAIVKKAHALPHAGLQKIHRHLFASPQPAGREITAGFTYVQRIGKAANYDVWFPDALRCVLDAKIAEGRVVSDDDFPAQWAAVRQFELLHEAGNYKIYDLDPADLKRAFLDLSRSMRAGGYRVTVATLGTYRADGGGDDLEILDRRLQKRIAQMIHMLYLDDASAEASAAHAAELAAQKWDFRHALPHVGMVLGARDLFLPDGQDDGAEEKPRRKKKGEGDTQRAHRRARKFFDILGALPQNHIVHDTAIGLQLPELNGENEWNYIAASDETLNAFSRALNCLFDCFNGVSLSRLHQRGDAHSETKSSTFHMRSYGHPLNDRDLVFYRGAALALA
ncbi:MAG: hypothetical protein KGI37_02140 [Alphaproteobacteria bacterium]|nr:hypothetical protein [Alphaproteobacteria bacterium]